MTKPLLNDTDIIRARGPIDLIGLVPYLLGFPPAASAVFVALGPDDGVRMVARIDLPPPDVENRADELAGALGIGPLSLWGDADPLDVAAQALIDSIHSVFDAARNAGADSFVVVLYDDAIDAHFASAVNGGRLSDVRQAFVRTLLTLVDERRLPMLDVLLVGPTRWRSAQCDRLSCCPPDGQLRPDQPTAAEASAVFAGLSVVADRGRRARSAHSTAQRCAC